MSMVLLRGRLLSFRRAPLAIDDTQSYVYIEDGGLLIEDGRIAAIGDYADIRETAPENVEEKDHRPHLIVPGLIDMHVHLTSLAEVGGYQGLVPRWDLMRVPADQGLMLTAITLAGLVLSMLFWSALPISTPHPHECCKKPEVKAAPLYKPVDTLNKGEKTIAQLTAQVEAIEKLKAEEEAAKEKDKDKGKAGKAKPADAKAPVKAPATP